MHIHTSIYVYIYTYYISSRTKIYVIHRAGMIAKTATNPLERIKMLSQTGEHGGGSAATNKGKLSILDLYRSIMRNEGIAGLWAGNGANLLRVFPVRWLVFGIWYLVWYHTRTRTRTRIRSLEKGSSQYSFNCTFLSLMQ